MAPGADHDERQVLSSEADRAAEGGSTRPPSAAGPAPEQDATERTPPHGDALAAQTEEEQAPEAASEEDHESKLAADLEELTAKAEKADEYLELAQRTKADFENYRKRAVRDAAAAQERGIAKLAKELLPAVDNLDRALENAEQNGADPLADGIKLVHAEVVAALSRAGIERFSPEGEQFDPQHHEAVAQQPIDGAEPGTIVEVYQRGYRIGESILRPARVLVAA